MFQSVIQKGRRMISQGAWCKKLNIKKTRDNEDNNQNHASITPQYVEVGYWTLKKQNNEIWHWRKHLRTLWRTKKTNKWFTKKLS